MEFTIDTVANKMIMVIITLSAIVATGGVVFFFVSNSFEPIEAIPFIIGVTLAMSLNIAKVFLLKQAIIKTSDMSSPKSAGLTFQVRYFLRFLLTIVVLFTAALAPDNIISLWGALIGVFVHPIAVYAMRFFIPADTIEPADKED